MVTPASNKNRSLALSLAAAALGMLMLAYASVPLYRLFCISTGFGGVAQKTAEQGDIPISSRQINVRFDANTAPALDWAFAPLEHDVTLKVGEKHTMEYNATNRGATSTQGTAMFNVTPVKAGKYFHKIQCFCFSDQTLAPQETKRLGVFFYLDPALLKDHEMDDVTTITLSYTFFPLKK